MVILTGGTGLLGGHLLWELIQADQPVRAILRPGGRKEKVLSVWKHLDPEPTKFLERVDWVEADLTNPLEIQDYIDEASLVYHCAGRVSFSKRELKDVYRTNVKATQTLVNVCLEKKVTKFMHVSSIASIGQVDEGKISDEDAPWTFHSRRGYSDSKSKAELEVWRGIAEGLNAVIVNPSVILGAGNWTQSSDRIFNVVYKGMKFHTPGTTGYVDVLDVVKAMLLLMKSDVSGERYILSAINLSFRDLFSLVAKSMNVEPPAKSIGYRTLRFLALLEGARAALTKSKPRITKQTANSAFAKKEYSSRKITELNGFTFRAIDDTINRIGKSYLEDCGSSGSL